MPKISVIVPIYNVEQYLDKCIKSILSQTFRDFELLLVDDGSEDRSSQICDYYKSIDSRVKVIHKENGGLSDARNVGIRLSKGEFLSFIDGDDTISKSMLEEMYNSINLYNADISICNMVRVFEDETKEYFYKPTIKEILFEDEEIFTTLNQPSVCNKLFRTCLFEDIRFPYGKYYEDTYIYHELLIKSNKVVLTGKDSYYYTCRKDSIIYDVYNKKYFDFVEAVYKRAKTLDDNNIHNYADDAYLHVYSSLSNAYKYIGEDCEEIKLCFENARNMYKSIYIRIKDDKHFSLKQKIRFYILRYFPKIHTIIY